MTKNEFDFKLAAMPWYTSPMIPEDQVFFLHRLNERDSLGDLCKLPESLLGSTTAAWPSAMGAAMSDVTMASMLRAMDRQAAEQAQTTGVAGSRRQALGGRPPTPGEREPTKQRPPQCVFMPCETVDRELWVCSHWYEIALTVGAAAILIVQLLLR